MPWTSAIFLTLLAQEPPPPQPPVRAPTVLSAAERTRVLRILDGLLPAAALKRPFVVVESEPEVDDDPALDLATRHGFLVRVEGADYTLQDLDGNKSHSSLRRLGYAPVDFRSFARQFAALCRSSRKAGADTELIMEGRSILGAAWASDRLGFRRERDNLLGLLSPSRREETLASWCADWLYRDFGNHQLGWDALAQRHGNWLKEFPGQPLAQVVAERLARINVTREADLAAEAAVKAAPTQPSKFGVLLTIRNARFSRVDAGNERFWGRWQVEPTSPSPADVKAEAAAKELVGAGLAAVPALIAALSDQTMTRTALVAQFSCGLDRRFPRLCAVRDVAQAVLIEIAGYRCEDAAGWQEWYQWARKDGVNVPMMKRFERHGEDWREIAAVVLRRWPRKGAGILIRHAKRYPESLYDVAGLLWEDQSEETTLFLRQQLQSPGGSNPLELQLRCVEILRGRGAAGLAEPLLRMWTTEVKGWGVPDQKSKSALLGEDWVLARLVREMLKSRHLTLLEQLVTDARLGRARKIVLDVLEKNFVVPHGTAEGVSARWEQQWERLLRKILDDERVYDPDSEAIFEDAVNEGLVCGDLAARHLARFWPKRYQFREGLTAIQRAAQRQASRQQSVLESAPTGQATKPGVGRSRDGKKRPVPR